MLKWNLSMLMALALVMGVVFVTGCDDDDNGGEDGEETLVGTWDWTSASITSPLVPGGSIDVTPELLGLLLGGTVEVTVIVDADGTWALSATIPPVEGYTAGGTVTAAGTWETDNGNLTLTVTSAGGLPDIDLGEMVADAPPITVPYSLAGNTLTVTVPEELVEDISEGGFADSSAVVVLTRR